MNWLLAIVIISGLLYIVASAGAERNGAAEIKELSRISFACSLLVWAYLFFAR